MLLYLRQEGRGIGLVNKIKAYELQDEGMDTVEANETRLPGRPARLRHRRPDPGRPGGAEDAAADQQPPEVRRPRGLRPEIVERVPIEIPPSDTSRRYLAKKEKLGHLLRGLSRSIGVLGGARCAPAGLARCTGRARRLTARLRPIRSCICFGLAVAGPGGARCSTRSSERLQGIFKSLRGQGVLSEAQVDAALREVRLALLEADVHFKVVKQFLERVRVRAVGQDVLKSLTPDQAVLRIVRDEMVEVLGGAAAARAASLPPTVILMAGLQGSGKTTTSAKLGRWLAGRGPPAARLDRRAAPRRPRAAADDRQAGRRQGAPSGA